MLPYSIVINMHWNVGPQKNRYRKVVQILIFWTEQIHVMSVLKIKDLFLMRLNSATEQE